MKFLVTSLAVLFTSLTAVAQERAIYFCFVPGSQTASYALITHQEVDNQSIITVRFGADGKDMETGLNEEVYQNLSPKVAADQYLNQGLLNFPLLSPDSKDLGYKVTNTGFIQIYPLSEEEIKAIAESNPELAGINSAGMLVHGGKITPLMCMKDPQ